MKYQELQAVHAAVQANINLLITTRGLSPLVGLEDFTETQLVKFDQLWDYYAPKALNGEVH